MKKWIVILTVLAACGGSSGWSDEARAEFIRGCQDGGGSEEACTCMQEKMEGKYPAEDDFESVDEAALTEDSITFAGECGVAG